VPVAVTVVPVRQGTVQVQPIFNAAPMAVAALVEFLGLARKQARVLGQALQVTVPALLMCNAAHMEVVETVEHQKSTKPLSI
jgi:hypothetical protein